MNKTAMERLKHERIKKNKTQKEVADFLGLTKQAVQRYEAGLSTPKLETWQKLADFFDVPVFYLQGTEKNLSEDEFARQSRNKRERETAYSLVKLVQKFADKELAPTQTRLLMLLVPIINSDNDDFLISLGNAFSSLELFCSEDFIGEDGRLEADQTKMIVDDFKEALETIYIPEYDYKK